MANFGLTLGKDGGYSKLMVILSSILSGTIFGSSVFLSGPLTVQWKAEYDLDTGLGFPKWCSCKYKMCPSEL